MDTQRSPSLSLSITLLTIFLGPWGAMDTQNSLSLSLSITLSIFFFGHGVPWTPQTQTWLQGFFASSRFASPPPLSPGSSAVGSVENIQEMGKRGGQKRESNGGATPSCGLHTSLSLREEASGRKQSHNPKSLLKLKHLQNLAEWATNEASIPSLGAFFGCRFAEFGEALGIRPDPSLFPCQRCETLLQPGFNCIVRIEKNQAKRRRCRGRTNPPTQNNVVYCCNFCSHRNLKRGTPKGHMREICPKTNLPPKLKTGNPIAQRSDNGEKSSIEKVEAQEAIETPSPVTGNVITSFADSQATYAPKLLDSNRRKRKKARSKGSTDQSMVGSAPADAKNASGTNTSRKRRKSWSTLKEIANSEELERNQRFQKLPIPFHL